ncbi:GSCOCT00014235001.2-RA-CDS [Cotesia congregata]|uniref:Cc_bv6.13_28.16 n=2 Tax=root TaxID=1 RepID=S6D2Y1_COTCN|nr:GSCOCT00014235001.2-RA-CDS [Cotesia congregata]CAG5092492.1 cc_bv6.13_28.16 [Cotesia congregata]CCB96396.1 hypothetical protein BV6-13 [Bracoviriform congregatae]CCQ71218.1 hypothetical protein BV6-13 [Cotesia congregata]
MSCNCLKKLKVSHPQVFMVPREWLQNGKLECILYSKMKFHYRKYGKCEGLVITLIEVKASFERYSNYLWARKDSDWATKPEKKSYLAVFVPCIYCSEL